MLEQQFLKLDYEVAGKFFIRAFQFFSQVSHNEVIEISANLLGQVHLKRE